MSVSMFVQLAFLKQWISQNCVRSFRFVIKELLLIRVLSLVISQISLKILWSSIQKPYFQWKYCNQNEEIENHSLIIAIKPVWGFVVFRIEAKMFEIAISHDSYVKNSLLFRKRDSTCFYNMPNSKVPLIAHFIVWHRIVFFLKKSIFPKLWLH